MKKNSLSEAASAMAKKGGASTLKKHGKKHYRKMAIKRWKNEKQK